MLDWILNLGMTGAENLTSGLKKVTSDLNEAAKAAEKQRKHAGLFVGGAPGGDC